MMSMFFAQQWLIEWDFVLRYEDFMIKPNPVRMAVNEFFQGMSFRLV